MSVMSLEQDNLFAHFDEVKRMAFIVYQNALTPQVTTVAYEWLNHLVETTTDIRACFFDFQQVRRFESSNITSAQRRSENLNREHDISKIPVALVVDNAYQEQMVKTTLKMSPQQDRKRIVRSYAEGFQFVQAFHDEHQHTFPDITDELMLNIDGASIWYDRTTDFMRINYYGVITPQTTFDVYSKMIENIGIIGDVKKVRAGLFDFRQVNAFDNTNLRTVQRSSQTMNTSYDMNHIAVALIVGNVRQERMVITAMKVTPQEARKRVVFSFADAHRFIEEFHAKRSVNQD